MDVVAIVALARSVEDEAPRLAADLGLTVYETGVMLRAAPPVIVLRTEDRARATDLVAKLRSRGHDVVGTSLDDVVASEDMFRPKSFRFDASDLVGAGNGEERRLPLGAILALVRATHVIRVEDTVTTRERKLSLGRAALTGGVLLTRSTTSQEKRVVDEREPVLYVFRADAAPWLLSSTYLRYEGLAQDMRASKAENFEVLVNRLRQLAPAAPYDARLLAVRATARIVSAGPNQLSTSSAGTVDVLAHVVATSLAKLTRPYR